MRMRSAFSRLASLAGAVLLLASPAGAQARGEGAGRGQAGPQVVSPEVSADRQITFRLLAPQAEAVRVNATDIPGVGPATALTKSADGVWEVTTAVVPPGAYRYQFNVDGVATPDARNPAASESRTTVWSLVHVPGSEVTDTRMVPHGNVAEVIYHSSVLGAFRRLHVYMPPGYEAGDRRYPVFYLLHGAGDSDDSWSTVGRAGIILDNLIAAGRARPMIVVMPAGHTPGGATVAIEGDAFVNEFVADIMPLVRKTYRVQGGRANTAIAGLSMGGSQTLNIAFEHLGDFAYVGVFSSGLLGAFPVAGRGGGATAPAAGPDAWASQHAAMLVNANLRKDLKLFWFATGKDDFLLNNTVDTVNFFKERGFTPVYKETAGGHTWLNWRDYLEEFGSQLFR